MNPDILHERKFLKLYFQNKDIREQYKGLVKPATLTNQKNSELLSAYNSYGGNNNLDMMMLDLISKENNIPPQLQKTFDEISKVTVTENASSLYEAVVRNKQLMIFEETTREALALFGKGQISKAADCLQGISTDIKSLKGKEVEFIDPFDRTYIEGQIFADENNPFQRFKTGIGKFDNITGGFDIGDFMILVAPSGCGKSGNLRMMALNLIQNNPDINVLYVSNEEMPKKIAYKLNAINFDIEYSRIKNSYKLDTKEKENWFKSIENDTRIFDRLKIVRIASKDTSSVIESVIKRAEIKYGKTFHVIIVDYLDRVGADAAVYSQWDEQSNAAQELKELAMSKNKVVITASQISTEAWGKMEKSTSKHLFSTDIQGSKGKIFHADFVVFADVPILSFKQSKTEVPFCDVRFIVDKARDDGGFEYWGRFHKKNAKIDYYDADPVSLGLPAAAEMMLLGSHNGSSQLVLKPGSQK